MPSDTACRLLLMTPPVVDADAFAPTLRDALAAAPIAAVLIRFGGIDPHTKLKAAKQLIALVQGQEVAAILEGQDDMIGKSGADGIHVHGTFALGEMLERFHPQKIVGAGGLRLKDDAMTAGERNVDYVMFGEPQSHPLPVPFDQIAERVGWWASIFEVPCVGYAPELGHAAELARLGADFVLLGDAVWNHAQGAADAVKAAAEQVATAGASAP
jgi:thiamine-phosphate pyrophosphorylase